MNWLPKAIGTLPWLMAVVLLWALTPASSQAASALRCRELASSASQGGPADALMAELESRFRRGTRIVRMDIRTEYRRHSSSGRSSSVEPSRKTLWGVFDGKPDRTHFLYVFSGPGRLAGTTLLMQDNVDPDVPDSMWLYLRAFDIFKLLGPDTERVLVPGTALSYEDSRGYIPSDKFQFFHAEPDRTPPDDEEASVRILACPRSDSIAKNLGYRSLALTVDPKKRLVRRIEYSDLAGSRLKIYSLVQETKLGDRYFPAEIRLQHFDEGFLTTIRYEHWLPEAAPPADLFVPSIEAGKFIDRLSAYLGEAGLGSRIEPELAEADEQLRAFQERLLAMPGGKEAVRGMMDPEQAATKGRP